jgi:hypothetical protein
MMNYSKLILAFIIFIQLSCQNNPKIEANQAPQYLEKNEDKVLKHPNIIELKKIGIALRMLKDVCQVGNGLRIKNGVAME